MQGYFHEWYTTTSRGRDSASKSEVRPAGMIKKIGIYLSSSYARERTRSYTVRATHSVFRVRVEAVVVVRRCPRAGQIAGARKVAHISTPGDLHLVDLWNRRPPPVNRINDSAPPDKIRSDGGGVLVARDAWQVCGDAPFRIRFSRHGMSRTAVTSRYTTRCTGRVRSGWTQTTVEENRRCTGISAS
jgi:hypothetical protein